MGEVGLIGTIGTSNSEVGALGQRDSSGNITKWAWLEEVWGTGTEDRLGRGSSCDIFVEVRPSASAVICSQR